MTIEKIIENLKNIKEMICESSNNEIITNGKIRGKIELIKQILPDLELIKQTQDELIVLLEKAEYPSMYWSNKRDKFVLKIKGNK